MRPAQAADDAFLEALFFERKRLEFCSLGWPEEALTALLASQAALRARAHAGLESWVLTTAEGEAAGQLVVEVSTGALRVVELVVAERFRGRGLGTAALTELIARADAEARVVRLAVEPNNPARSLYRRLGFVDDGGPTSQLRQPR